MSEPTRSTGAPVVRHLCIPWAALDVARNVYETAVIVEIWTKSAAGSRRITASWAGDLQYPVPVRSAEALLERLEDAGVLECYRDGDELVWAVT
jgi:hypothetical protein